MKKLFMLVLLAFASGMALAAENYAVVFKTQGKYEDVRDYIRTGIES